MNKRTYKKNRKKRSYLFGYGSLTSKHSRKTTQKRDAKAFPVVLKKKANYKRKWTCFNKYNSMYKKPISFLNVVKGKKGNSINGVLFNVRKKGLKRFDKREGKYNRIKLNNADLKTCSKKHKIPKGNIYTYTSKYRNYLPTKKCKIKQSYLDVVLDGTLEYGKEFAKKFNTKIKRKYVTNDRKNKKKYKKFDYTKKLDYKNIDEVVKENKLLK